MSLKEKIATLINSTETAHASNNANSLVEEITAASLTSSDIGVDLEIVFRQSLDNLLKQNQMVLEKATILHLLQFSIQIGLQCSNLSPNCPKIPFLLIEDLLECQTLKHAASIWEIVESMVDVLTQPELFNRGKFVILRTCNSLLRRLSKSCHTEFCGRVLMFLAAIYPLSERSAVNLMGKVNTSNVTGYEEQTTFESVSGIETDFDVDNLFDGHQMELEGDEEVKSQPTTKKLKTDSVSNSHTRDYALYKTFWNIQSSLASDPKTLESKNIWPSLLSDIEVIISTFEADSFRKSEIALAKSRREAAILSSTASTIATSTPTTQHQYMGCKYLTSSQLFSLELKDPAIRQQICTQILILLHHRIRKPPAPAPTTVLTTKKGSTSTVDSTNTSSTEELKALQNRIFSLIESTPSGGEDLAMTLRSVFCEGREDYWMKWKQDGCASFERTTVEDLKNGTNKNTSHKKRKFSNLTNQSKKDEKYYFEHSLETTQKTVQTLTSNVPSFEKHIIDFLDAEDPDAGIEDAYHPKHDSVYCWRARRLMANHRLSLFESMGDGNIAKGLEVLYPKNASNKLDEESNSTQHQTNENPQNGSEDAKEENELVGTVENNPKEINQSKELGEVDQQETETTTAATSAE